MSDWSVVLHLVAGPNGTAASFEVNTASTAGARRLLAVSSWSPLTTYDVVISGWTHWGQILYSVWFYWASDTDQQLFRLSEDSTSTTHTVRLPGTTTADDIVLVARAMDGYEYPVRSCTSCSQQKTLSPLSQAEMEAIVNQLISESWSSVQVPRCVA